MQLFLIIALLRQFLSTGGTSLLAGFEHFAQSTTPQALSAVWQGTLIAFALAVALKLAPRISATQRFKLWAAAFVATFALPFVPLVFAILSPGHPSPALDTSVVSAPHAWLLLDPRWSLWVAGLWLVSSAARAVDLLLNAFRLRKLWKSAVPTNRDLGLARQGSFAICTTTELDRPSVIGFFAPRILIPEWLSARLSTGELDHIVLHESEHLRRRDDWTNLFQKLCLVVFPLNPALWFMERQLAREREMACDEAVVRLTESPRAYAACLASLAEHGLQRRAEALSLGAWQRRPELVQRVQSILHRRKALHPATARVLIGSFSCCLAIVALELARCPQLVAFVPAPVTASARLSQANSETAQFGDAAYPSQPNRLPLASGFYALPAKAVLPEPKMSKPFLNHAPKQITRPKAAPVGDFMASSTALSPISLPPRHEQILKSTRSQIEAADAQQVIVFTTWEQVETSASTTQTTADYDPNPGANQYATGRDMATATNTSPKSRITVTQLIFKVVPRDKVNSRDAQTGFKTAQPAAVPIGDGWFLIQL
jgi:beta-lactamase regulating signal transducer with metallopeptidase domain